MVVVYALHGLCMCGALIGLVLWPQSGGNRQQQSYTSMCNCMTR